MKIVIQRVKKAHIRINNEIERNISKGIVVLLGITHDDTKEKADFLVDKCVNLRIFNDEAGVMNKSLLDINGDIMIVSQFTLYADANKGRRPSYLNAANAEKSIPIYDYFVDKVRKFNLNSETGEFGADMQITLTNDGPVTIIVEK